jgi:hypothetical protein
MKDWESLMSLRRKLLWIWLGFTVLWWLLGLASDGSHLVLKFQVGGWRAAYVHVVLFLVMLIGVPLTVFLLGWGVLWIWRLKLRSPIDGR